MPARADPIFGRSALGPRRRAGELVIAEDHRPAQVDVGAAWLPPSRLIPPPAGRCCRNSRPAPFRSGDVVDHPEVDVLISSIFARILSSSTIAASAAD